VTGTATFNVSPQAAGSYFSKIECFCFTEQTLEAGERVDMPVTFFIDPEIVNDPETRNIQEITLSYTFFPVSEGAEVAAAGKNAPRPDGT
jgi:cytochrome c oxidase assembly protein subunit 11